jgi:glucokinase
MKQQDPAAPVVAVDIGGTKVLAALVTPAGELRYKAEIPTRPEEGVDAVVRRIGDLVQGVLDGARLAVAALAGLGIACAGGVDTARGVIVTPSPHLPDWTGLPLRDRLTGRFPVPAALLNDASAAALGEHRYGAGRGSSHLVLLTLGTGVGGGIITNGRLYLGASGAAGEIGHMTVADGPECGCGNTGCLEMLASGTAIAREADRRLRDGEPSVLTAMTGGNDTPLTAEMVAGAAASGDALARAVLERAGHYLGVGLVNLVNIFNPEVIVLGGGMAALDHVLVDPARRLVAERAFGISAAAVRIVRAELGNNAGVCGAAAYVRDEALS